MSSFETAFNDSLIELLSNDLPGNLLISGNVELEVVACAHIGIFPHNAEEDKVLLLVSELCTNPCTEDTPPAYNAIVVESKNLGKTRIIEDLLNKIDEFTLTSTGVDFRIFSDILPSFEAPGELFDIVTEQELTSTPLTVLDGKLCPGTFNLNDL